MEAGSRDGIRRGVGGAETVSHPQQVEEKPLVLVRVRVRVRGRGRGRVKG